MGDTLSDQSWIYNDAFLLVISTALALRFEQITERLQKNMNRAVAKDFWREIREDYVCLCKLSRLLNSCISFSVLISFQLNLYFILERLYYTFE